MMISLVISFGRKTITVNHDLLSDSQVLELQQYENKQLPSINRINGSPFDPHHFGPNQSASPLSSEENGKLFLGPIKSSHFSATFNLTLDTSIHHYPIKKVALFIKFANSYDYWEKDITVMQLKGGTNTTYESFLGKVGPRDEDEFNRFHYSENDIQDSDKWKLYDLTNIILREKDNHPAEERLIVVDGEQKKINSTILSVEFDFTNVSRPPEAEVAGKTLSFFLFHSRPVGKRGELTATQLVTARLAVERVSM